MDIDSSLVSLPMSSGRLSENVYIVFSVIRIIMMTVLYSLKNYVRYKESGNSDRK